MLRRSRRGRIILVPQDFLETLDDIRRLNRYVFASFSNSSPLTDRIRNFVFFTSVRNCSSLMVFTKRVPQSLQETVSRYAAEAELGRPMSPAARSTLLRRLPDSGVLCRSIISAMVRTSANVRPSYFPSETCVEQNSSCAMYGTARGQKTLRW